MPTPCSNSNPPVAQSCYSTPVKQFVGLDAHFNQLPSVDSFETTTFGTVASPTPLSQPTKTLDAPRAGRRSRAAIGGIAVGGIALGLRVCGVGVSPIVAVAGMILGGGAGFMRKGFKDRRIDANDTGRRSADVGSQPTKVPLETPKVEAALHEHKVEEAPEGKAPSESENEACVQEGPSKSSQWPIVAASSAPTDLQPRSAYRALGLGTGVLLGSGVGLLGLWPASPLLIGVCIALGIGSALGLGWAGYLLGDRFDAKTAEFAFIDEIRGEWDCDALDFCSHYEQAVELNKKDRVKSRIGQDRLRVLQQDVHSRLIQAIEALLAKAGTAGDKAAAATEAATLLTSPVCQGLPNFPYRVENLVTRLSPEQTVPALLRRIVAQRTTEYNRHLSPYHQHMHALDAICFGREQGGSNWLGFFQAAAISMVDGGVSMGLATLTGGLSRRLMGTSQAADFAVGNSIARASQGSVENMKKAWREGVTSKGVRMQQIYHRIKTTYASEVALLPEPFRKNIEDYDRKIEDYIKKEAEDHFYLALRRRQGPLLSVPTHVRRLEVDTASDEAHQKLCAEIDADVELLLASYPHFHDLRDFIEQIRNNSRMRTLTGRLQKYLLGAPGVGKSHFVHELGRVLRLPVCVIDLSSADDVKALGGEIPNLSFLTAHDEKITDAQLLGMIQFKIIESGCVNPILFFDEAGDLLSKLDPDNTRPTSMGEMGMLAVKSTIKKLFDPTKSILPLTVFAHGASINFMHPTIIFAGNSPLENAAIKKRIDTMVFPAVPLSQKEVIARANVERAVNNLNGLDAVTREKLMQEANAWLPQVLAEDKRSGDAGVHTLTKKAIPALVSEISYRVLRRECIDPNRLGKKVQKCYRG